MPSAFPHIPLHGAKPDASRFIDVVLGRARSERTPLVEYLVDDALRKPITTQMLGRPWVDPTPDDRASQEAYLDNFVAFWQGMGYDFVRFEQELPFLQHSVVGDDATQADGKRSWRDQHHGTITNWDEFERYPWPVVTPAFLANYAYLNDHLPEGMGLIVAHAGGIYEHLASVMSYEGLCLALYDAPDLVAAIAEKLGGVMLQVYEQLVELDRVIAIFPGDDMGFRSATLIQPDALRRYTLPWHRRYAELAHQHGLPYFLHSCGNLTQILDDLIDDVRIDAKHSFENAILPVDALQARYGHRVGVLGGMDVDILGRRSPDEVRAATRAILDTCHPRGRFAIGSGNSVPSYVPVENYLAMVDEAQR